MLVVASSQSFGAVSQEQFYVSISRAKERARIYTDDAELLGRRVEDTHTRKAAVELEGLREALRRAGYTRTPTPAPATTERQSQRRTRTERAAQTIRRVVRQLRELRTERLAPIERVTKSVRQWLGQRLGVERTMTQSEHAREFITQAQRAAQQQRQSQSRGIRM